MNSPKTLLLIALAALSCRSAAADEGAPSTSDLPGFVFVPEGIVHPGTTYKEAMARAGNVGDMVERFRYEVWGEVPEVRLAAFYAGRYEVTNAQWKHYLDTEHRVDYETQKGDTLSSLARRFANIHGRVFEDEWKAYFCLNHHAIASALSEAGLWKSEWHLASPPEDLASVQLPEGLKLVLYRHRIPTAWYGWSGLSGRQACLEYCDAAKPAHQAFAVPDGEPFDAIRFRDKDFAAYPVHEVSPAEAQAFAEWAGCSLLSEYEWERLARGDRPNTVQHPYEGDEPWDHEKDKGLFRWLDNAMRPIGTSRVDDESVAGGDSPFGARHMLGNVWEMTRTFFDTHPYVEPAPPPDLHHANYAFIAKGGSYGDGRQMLKISVRAPKFHNTQLVFTNRFDAVGLRLARHPQEGYDALLHSVLRMCYDVGGGKWLSLKPHEFAMVRASGIDKIHIEDVPSPYAHVRARAKSIAAAPLWWTDMDDKAAGRVVREWKKLPRDSNASTYYVLGVLRSDVPFYAGVRMTEAAAKELEEKRKAYEEAKKEYDRAKKKWKRGEPEPVPPEPVDEEDEYEKATAHNREIVGIWRRSLVQPGEWLVVNWYGFVGLVNKSRVMPPAAILLPPKGGFFDRKPGREVRSAVVRHDAEKDVAHLEFWAEEQPSDGQAAPGAQDTEVWALCQTLGGKLRGKEWQGWPGRKPGSHAWRVAFSLELEKGAFR